MKRKSGKSKRDTPKLRSAPAQALADRKFHQRVVQDKRRKARSPSDDSPPAKVLPPRLNTITGKYIIECPNGEKIEYTSREAAWKDWQKLKWEF